MHILSFSTSRQAIKRNKEFDVFIHSSLIVIQLIVRDKDKFDVYVMFIIYEEEEEDVKRLQIIV